MFPIIPILLSVPVIERFNPDTFKTDRPDCVETVRRL